MYWRKKSIKKGDGTPSRLRIFSDSIRFFSAGGGEEKAFLALAALDFEEGSLGPKGDGKGQEGCVGERGREREGVRKRDREGVGRGRVCEREEEGEETGGVV